MDITTQITKWQATFLLVESSNEPFQQKQHKIWSVVREVTDSYDQIMNSPNVAQANVALLFTNVSLYAQRYNVDTCELQFKLLMSGLSNIFR